MDDINPLIRKAGHFARHAHWGQRRKYRGAPYSHHPFRVARAVAGHEIGSPVTVAAALLHDAVEDTAVSSAEILREFGPDVARLVSELTKLDRVEAMPRKAQFDRELARLKKISREAKIIKLFDRIDNVRESRAIIDAFTERYLEAIGDADPILKQQLREVIAACK